MLISNEIDNAVRLRTLETLLTALDNCSDMVQITDHEDKIIFQNSVGERVLGYSSSDYASGDRHLWDFQSTAAMYSHAVLEENDTAVRKDNFFIDITLKWCYSLTTNIDHCKFNFHNTVLTLQLFMIYNQNIILYMIH